MQGRWGRVVVPILQLKREMETQRVRGLSLSHLGSQ